MGQGLGIVGGEAVDVLGREAGTRERRKDPRQVQRRRVREHIALGERSGVRVAVTQARDHVVQLPRPRLKQTSEPLRVAIDLDATDVLNHADARDRVEALAGELAVIHHADLDPVGDARPRRPMLHEARLD